MGRRGQQKTAKPEEQWMDETRRRMMIISSIPYWYLYDYTVVYIFFCRDRSTWKEFKFLVIGYIITLIVRFLLLCCVGSYKYVCFIAMRWNFPRGRRYIEVGLYQAVVVSWCFHGGVWHELLIHSIISKTSRWRKRATRRGVTTQPVIKFKNGADSASVRNVVSSRRIMKLFDCPPLGQMPSR